MRIYFFTNFQRRVVASPSHYDAIYEETPKQITLNNFCYREIMESKSQKTLQREEDMEVDSSSSEEEEEFEAKCIVGDRIKNGRKEYLV